MSSRFNDLMQDWEYKPLSEILAFIVDNRGKSVPTEQWGIPLIATNCIKNSELFPTYDKVRYVSKETYDSWFRSHPIPGDIIFVNKGKPGSVAMVPEPVDFCMAQDMMAFRVKKDIIYNKFLFAVLRSQLFQTQIMNYHVGTMIPHFKKSDLDKLLIPVPDMKIQEYIGNLYYNFSYKIEVNNQINKTLENIAQTIFKQWFVDFEFPNGAKEPYKSSGGEMVESELGMIPKGWEVTYLRKIIDIVKQGTKPGEYLKSRKYNPIDTLPMKTIAMNDYKSYEEAKSSLILFEKYDILVGAMRVYFHRVNLAPYKGITRTTTFVLRSKRKEDMPYNLFLINMNETIEYAEKTSKGSTMPYAVWENGMGNFVIAHPSKALRDRFFEIIQPLLDSIINRSNENKALMALRDSLLPKLMSGEIRVPIEEN